VDVLSDILKTVRISGSVLFRAEFTAPWSLAAPHSRLLAPMFVPNAKRMLLFHIVEEGSCWAQCEGGAPVAVNSGDLVVLPYGDALVMSDEPGRAPDSILPLLPPLPWQSLPVLRHGGNGAMTRILCGFLHADETQVHPLLANMPPLLCIQPQKAFPRLQSIVQIALSEAREGRPGGGAMLNRLAEIMFVEILRRSIEEQQDGLQPLTALKDPLLGRVLTLLHGDPARDWTVEMLAREAGSSRSVLAERFDALVGCPPITYLSRWRMQLAMHRLRDTRDTNAAIAAHLGYGSEPAFSKAFKREVGMPPAAWRRQNSAL
jgi:AraC-like DNA-binding protein